MSTTT